MQNQKIVLVTGGNRGIGLAIVTSLAEALTDSVIIVGCRDPDAGNEVIRSMASKGSNRIEALRLDVSSDESIRQAVRTVDEKYHRLDVLVNNAGYAANPMRHDLSDLRNVFQDMFNVNVSSVAMLTHLFLPLLRASATGGKVIQIGSARGSITKLANGELPPTASVGYSVSKTAMHALTLQMAIAPENADVEFQIATPGHCKTALNGYKGLRDPVEGANVVVELTIGGRRPTKCWETKGANKNLIEVPW